MNRGSEFWGRVPIRRLFFVLLTLEAWITTASLLIILRYAPLTRGAPLLTYTPVFTSILPWLAGCKFWTMVGKRAKAGVADTNSTGLCYHIIVITVGVAYTTVLTIEPLLILTFSRVK
jgi:hypothetical protein